MALELAGPLTHHCMACGTGCHGTAVQILDEERASLLQTAAALSVPNPLDGDQLRHVDGRACVFLSADQRCRIHAEVGYEAKPLLCRQYPLVAVAIETEDVRAGIDPGCAYAWKSWPDGPEVPDEEVVLANNQMATYDSTVELAMIGLCDPNVRGVGGVLGTLRGMEGVSGLPIGIASRLARHAVVSRIGERLAHPDNAVVFQKHLGRVSALLEHLDPNQLPGWRLGLAEERWAVEATRRFLFLRLNTAYSPLQRTLGMLTGAVLCGWASPEPERFGPALACWSRVMRTDALGMLYGTDEDVQAIVRR